MLFSGFLAEKMTITTDSQGVAQYRSGDVHMNSLIGQSIRFSFNGQCRCLGCQAETTELKDGYCDSCQQTVALCDLCRVKPETCHYAQGTCREPSWGEKNCMTSHIVYLSNTSGIKIGITREKNVADFSRWLDQGATQALPLMRVSDRLTAGLVEIVIAKVMADKTNWRTMLTQNGEVLDLQAIAAQLTSELSSEFALFGDHVTILNDSAPVSLSYPVEAFPAKVGNAINIKKTPTFEGVLKGIKGQYLMIEIGGKIEVINLRKYAGYHVALAAV